MRGKNFIIGLITFFTLIGISLAGLTTPLPIAVQLSVPNEVQACYYEVKITNERTGEVERGLTNQYFEYLVDWANSDLKYQYGDIFKIESAGKVVEIRYTASPPTELIDINSGEDINFVKISIEKSEHSKYCIEGLEEEIIIITPVCPDCPDCNCPVCLECPNCDCQVCNECPNCNCPEDITPYKECNSCCEECPKCTGTDMNTLILFILSFFGIGLAGGTYGYKFVVRKRKGTGKLEIQITQHKHCGMNRYHSINTIHNKNPHKKGEINPKYTSYGKYIPEEEEEK